MSPSKDLHYDKAETVVRTELAFYKHTHRPEVVANPSLFKLLRISHGATQQSHDLTAWTDP